MMYSAPKARQEVPLALLALHDKRVRVPQIMNVPDKDASL